MARTRGARFSASQKKELWERLKRGQSMNEIAQVFARQRGSIHWVLSSTGGIEPPIRRRSRLTLSLSEREEISRGLAEGQSMREIASLIQRAPSTVSREVRRHCGRARYRAAEGLEQRTSPETLSACDSSTTAENCGQEIAPQLVTGADLWVAEVAISRRQEDADLPRNHLPKPLCSGSRRAEERAHRAFENAASDAAMQEQQHSQRGTRFNRRCGFHPRASC